MKSLINAVALAALVAAPAVSFAQSSQQPVTRAQVRAELVQLEQAGYNPNDWMHYPENIQAAQAKIAAAQNAGATVDATGYGANAAAASQSGQRVVVPAAADRSSVYFGH
ncbi:DUF4148 domain-containing protein [Burkholderia dolosa]|jgi:ribose 5-phosphate isomerase RpiB|uniref:DUF4148 domain-containing protein n=1 Tax=Burkholderia dolosa TaxID=152500 RepID=A0A892IH03_9BURK|nr:MULTISPECIES: DUF4148 domain-containing protein [Burkholderia]AKE05896.1 hypothetical protein XM57_25255 [Burkholderia cepacia]AJY09113.1 hypothetical protein AK34_4042 [Burkholderia dolosa AU0158]AYZ93775.1 DUF4148 domain-containing protein [Burkholderia dolosa]EAY70500.1 hypothetical protein BDAG_03299 [Burkholderia dolosa AU0158]ETP62501.1 hypothetical protein BDSB_19280 [Burkholderia dolosa PC543]